MFKEKFNNGREFFRKHMAMIILALHFSLTTGFAITNLLVPLVFTKQSNTPEKAQKRYINTLFHLLKWFTGDVWDAPNGDSYKSVQEVRRMHTKVAKKMNSDLKDKQYVSQYDMAIVLSGFMGAVVMYPKGFGIRCTKQELDDYVFFWRCIGYLLGINDKYNICANGYQEAYDICKEIEFDLLLPGLRDAPKDFKMMSEAYINGTNLSLGFPMYSTKSIIAMSAMENKWPNFDIPYVSWADFFRMWYLKFLTSLVWWIPGFEKFLNARMSKAHDYFVNKFVKKST